MGPLAYVLPEVLGWDTPAAADWVEVVPAGAGSADVVVTVVGPGEEETMLAEACRAAEAAPVLAILLSRDEVLGRRVMACGASGWLGLNEPPAMLQAMMAAAVARRLWPDRWVC
jgi:hypothetical protein